MARTGEEKIERDDYGEKGREPEGVVEVEETHVCTGTVQCGNAAQRVWRSACAARRKRFVSSRVCPGTCNDVPSPQGPP